MTVHQQLSQALGDLEEALRASQLWQVTAPDPAAMISQQPFCVDTMSLPQWLRFVFIQRLQALADAGGDMPAKCEVAPAVAVYLQQENIGPHEQQRVIKAVERVDDLVTRN